MFSEMRSLLQRSSLRHGHLCPRQVLGVRIGLAGLTALQMRSPLRSQSGLIIIETDGCFADGIEAATGATVGHRTLRINDLGKIAATFANVHTGRAVRIKPRADARAWAWKYAQRESRRYFVQLEGYQSMPEAELLCFQEVVLDPPAAVLVSSPSARGRCHKCGEEINNGRQLLVNGKPLCYSCAGRGYYTIRSEPAELLAVGTAAADY